MVNATRAGGGQLEKYETWNDYVGTLLIEDALSLSNFVFIHLHVTHANFRF